VEATLNAWSRADKVEGVKQACSAIAPHAGWYYSGRVAWSAWNSAAEVDTVVILGGHLPGGADYRYYPEDGFDTPGGVLESDSSLVNSLAASIYAVPDQKADNTVEVHLPMSAFRFSGKPVACFRVPNDMRAGDFGKMLALYASSSGKRLFVIGSTDLTHYGRAYDFEPAGPGQKGFAWARSADDSLINAFKAMDEAEALRLAEKDGSACSVGAAIAAISFAKHSLANRSRLLMQGSSDQLTPGSDSSVGYCSLAFMPEA
jgi:AmmeMemoRadiSam system protein B